MGSLTLPASGVVYADAQIFIYSVEKHPKYAPPLRALWQQVDCGSLEVATSELTLLETLVAPFRQSDAKLTAAYEQFFMLTRIRLLPITQPALLEAARLRAAHPSLRTPDAIHAAAASLLACASFLTNDTSFRQIVGLPLLLLDDVLGS